MASELRLTTLANNAGTESVDTTYVINGSAKAWMTAVGDGTAVDDSLNTSSLTDGGVGVFTQNYTNSFNNAHYSWVGQQESTFSTTAVIIAHNHSAKTTPATQFFTYNTGGGANTDTEECCSQITGDLA